MVDLSVKIGKLKLKNPVIAASGTFGMEYKKLIDVGLLGAIITKTITLKELRPALPKVVDSIDGRMDRFVITRHGKPVVVMLGVGDYEALMETLDILADPEAKRGIRQGVKEASQGRTRSWQEIKRSLEKI